jgi:hypothetical protein
MDQTSNTVTRLNKASHQYHAIFTVHPAAAISTPDFMSQFADVLKAFECYLGHREVAFHIEHYGHRHSEFERDVALLFHPVHGYHGRGSSR